MKLVFCVRFIYNTTIRTLRLLKEDITESYVTLTLTISYSSLKGKPRKLFFILTTLSIL